MIERIQGKAVLITGGTSGIGLAVAELFAKQQAKVAVNGRDHSKGSQALKKIQKVAKDAVFIQGDVSQYIDCQRIVRQTVEHFGKLDIVINSAGMYIERLIADITEADFHYVMGANLAGTYWICKFAAQELRKIGGGSIVNISSDAGLRGNLLCTAYCAAKGAVISFTKALALELAPYHIRVNCICPGDVATPMLEQQLVEARDSRQYIEEIKKLYPLGRVGTPEEVAQVICFLASPAAAFVTEPYGLWMVE